MTVLLVLASFLVFLTVDWVLQRRRAAHATAAPAIAQPVEAAVPALQPVFVGGYQLPDGLHYHRGHTWARVVGPDTAVIGMDDFARRLTGRADAVRLPGVGAEVEQGATEVRLQSRGRDAGLVMPVGGEVVDVNPALRDQPSLATDDPYGRGWMMKVRAPNLAAQVRNLLDGQIARRWTEDAREQLELRLMALSGSVLQDGGEPAPDFADHLDPDAWKSLRATFLLS